MVYISNNKHSIAQKENEHCNVYIQKQKSCKCKQKLKIQKYCLIFFIIIAK